MPLSTFFTSTHRVSLFLFFFQFYCCRHRVIIIHHLLPLGFSRSLYDSVHGSRFSYIFFTHWRWEPWRRWFRTRSNKAYLHHISSYASARLCLQHFDSRGRAKMASIGRRVGGFPTLPTLVEAECKNYPIFISTTSYAHVPLMKRR